MEIVLVVAGIGYVLARRLMGEPAQAKRMLILPAVLTVIGLSDLSGQVKTPLSLLFLVATAGVSLALGALRGWSVRISQQDGLAFIRYTGTTVALWVLNLVVKFGANLVLGAVDSKDAGAVGNSLLFTLGLGILAEGAVALYRALSADHRVMWTQGQDGAPHRMSPFLDTLQHSLNGRADVPEGESWSGEWNTRSRTLRRQRRR
ncbi:hypothetical protein K7472_10180 [Streptomyces sp. PTM05]|uniref:DUF1453 domain-containing protein n=1 Tax=Streptantibioticus parmotrematis TaxID=2873249 RepID=A0ABS7QR37_9ACTN|nr:hypothetical protein [Streptantibioticus parmotrematis]MBY8885211.1 hypothetical protein [Streptantibioticus parmotrematis]